MPRLPSSPPSTGHRGQPGLRGLLRLALLLLECHDALRPLRLVVRLVRLPLAAGAAAGSGRGGAAIESSPPAFPAQFWYKPLPGGATAVLLINNGNATAPLSFSFAAVPSMAGVPHSFAVRDVWAHADLPAATGAFTAPAVGPRDSAFLRFTPAA